MVVSKLPQTGRFYHLARVDSMGMMRSDLQDLREDVMHPLYSMGLVGYHQEVES